MKGSVAGKGMVWSSEKIERNMYDNRTKDEFLDLKSTMRKRVGM